MSTPTTIGEVPQAVLRVLQDAVRGDLLTDVDAMATALAGAGWVRGTGSGSWSCPADPAWDIWSASRAEHVSIFFAGTDDGVVRDVAARVRALVDAGQAGPVLAGEPDPEWTSWTGGAVVLALHVEPQRWWHGRSVPATVHVSVHRTGAAAEGPPPDPERARRLAAEGSAVARWYLAGEADLPEDVVDLLSRDDDPSVVAALAANEGQRRLARDEA